jgi:hypothetical protein
MDPIFYTYLNDLITIKKLKKVKRGNKNIISTCIFMPERPSVRSKTTVYISGLMKNIETFSRTMGDDWILRVYCDDMYFSGVKPKVINAVARSDSMPAPTPMPEDYDSEDYDTESEPNVHSTYANATLGTKGKMGHDDFASEVVSRLKSDESVFESVRNASLNNNSEVNTYVKDVRKEINDNKIFLKKIEKIMNFYLKKIISSGESRYKNIEIFSYSCPKASNEEVNFLGHYNTFGSIIRFLPLFDDSVSTMFCVNSRYSISPMLKALIVDWNKNPDKKMFTFSYEAGFIEKNIKGNIDHQIENIRIREKKRKIANVDIDLGTDLLFKECFNTMYEIKHGIFGDTSTAPKTFEDIGKFTPTKYNYSSTNYKLDRLNGFINCDFKGDYEDSKSVAAGIFGIKNDCPMIEARKRIFAKMLRYYILTSEGEYSFDFGIDETLLKVFIAFEVGTMDFHDNSIYFKELGQRLNSNNNSPNGLKINYITNFDDVNLAGIPFNCVSILNLFDSKATFLTDTNNNPITLKLDLETEYVSYETIRLFENISLYDIRLYDSKSLLTRNLPNGTTRDLNKNERITFNWCIGQDADNLQIDIVSLFTYFDEDKPLYIYDSSKKSELTSFVKQLYKRENEYYTWVDLASYNSEKELLSLINEVVSYFKKSSNFVEYKINGLEINSIKNISMNVKGLKIVTIKRDRNTNKLGMSIKQDKYGNYVIYDIEYLGPADFAGLSVNDIITEFNGVNLNGLHIENVYNVFKKLERDRIIDIDITFKKNNPTETIKQKNTYAYNNLNQSLYNNLSTKELYRKKYSKKALKTFARKGKRYQTKTVREPKRSRVKPSIPRSLTI